jgi:hypothetical protein
MNITLFQGLNAIRQEHKLTFKERKHLEVITHKALLQTKEGIGRPWIMPNEITYLQEERTRRKDPRKISIRKLHLAVIELLAKVYLEEATDDPQLEETLSSYNELCSSIEEFIHTGKNEFFPSIKDTAVTRG